MTEQKIDREAEATSSTVTLVVDYGHGVRKTFSDIPWIGAPGCRDMAVPDSLEAARTLGPGLDVGFEQEFVDRGGRDVGSIHSIDGVAAEEEGSSWAIFINEKPAGAQLRRVVPESVTKFGLPSIDPGDVVLLKLETAC